MILAYFAFTLIWAVADWAFISADWIGTTRDACTSEGACWVFISVRWDQFMYGFYPEAELWRPRLFYATLAIFVALLAYEKHRNVRGFGCSSSTSTHLSLLAYYTVVFLD